MLRPGVGGHAIGSAAQPGGFGGGGTTGGDLDVQQGQSQPQKKHLRAESALSELSG